MSVCCVECGKEFEQYVTGRNFHCTECHDEIIRGLNNDKGEVIKPSDKIIEDPVSTNIYDDLIKSEKYYHSMEFHRKFYK